MATLPQGTLDTITAAVQRIWSQDGVPTASPKVDIAAAVAAIDGYFDANAATMNAAIPAAPRAALTTGQKWAVVALCAYARAQSLGALPRFPFPHQDG